MPTMTGFGRAQKTQKGLSVEAQLSSVNKRGQEISVNLPRELSTLEGDVYELMRTAFERGKLQLNVRVQLDEKEADDSDLAAHFKRLKTTCDKLKVPFDPDAELVWDLLQARSKNDTDTGHAAPTVLQTIKLAVENCQKVQLAEGKRLQKDFLVRLKKLASLRATAIDLAKDSLPLQRQRLEKNLQAAGLTVEANDERVLKELAFFADRVDITEELTRINVHLQAAHKLIVTNGSIGRQIEFLLQELQREWNTLGNKSVQIELIQTALAAKNEIERMREQAANIA